MDIQLKKEFAVDSERIWRTNALSANETESMEIQIDASRTYVMSNSKDSR